MNAPDRWFRGISWVEKDLNIGCTANESEDHIFNGDHHDDNGQRSVRFAARGRPSIQTHRRERVRAFGSAKRSSRSKAKVPAAQLHRSSLRKPDDAGRSSALCRAQSVGRTARESQRRRKAPFGGDLSRGQRQSGKAFQGQTFLGSGQTAP